MRRTTNPRTIWDEQSVKEQTLDETPPTKLSSSYDSKPKYFPTKSSTHFGFQARPETKPGAITPTYATKRPKSAQSPIRNIPILNEDNFVVNKPGNKDDVVNKDVKSEECENSCQKSDTSTFTFQPIKTRSQSPINTKFVNKSKIKYKGKFKLLRERAKKKRLLISLLGGMGVGHHHLNTRKNGRHSLFPCKCQPYYKEFILYSLVLLFH